MKPDPIVPDATLRATLRYLVAASEVGVQGCYINAFAKDFAYKPRSVLAISTALDMFAAKDIRAADNRLVDLGLASELDGSLFATRLGRQIDDSSRVDEASNEHDRMTISEVSLSRDDPMVWPLLIERLASLGQFMVVDPYFDYLSLRRFRDTELRRIVVGEQLRSQGRLAALLQAAEILSKTGDHPEVEIRVAKRDELHDRYLISPDEVWSLGISLNGLGVKSTVLIKLADAAEAVRSNLENIWGNANQVWPPPKSEESLNSNTDVES